MKSMLIILLSLNLYAGLFTPNSETATTMIDNFREVSRNANAIVKKGEHQKYATYKSQTKYIANRINSLNLSTKNTKDLKMNLLQYSKIIDSVYNNIDKSAPNINKNYAKSLNGLVSFNKSVESTGYAPLLREWYKLTKLKHKFLKKPSSNLEKKFYETWKSVEIVLIDLCVDEEEELLAYLEVYKNYFKDLSLVYSQVEYSNIQKIKPLSYAIKSKLEFAIEQDN